MTRGHVNVDILPLHLGPRARYWLALVTMLVALAFCVVIFILCTIYWYEAYSEAGCPIRSGARGCGFRYLSMPIGLAWWSCNIWPNCLRW